ncbi:MAG TPA: hypothetical protein VNQ80_18130 [Parapedobacter sp.]|uniref:hypothetical protein n=1 Tax=Parapedobacter sp. TaxID=1958893 RepID=UPI002B51D65A|nr:hypothetical protein [Parapedobacter sp.]HWK59267.1 hypothetical protein [Parapedobacter sp.]
MQIDVYTLSDILVAHRRAMAAYRKEHLPLGRNAIEVMLYAYRKYSITTTEVSRNLLRTNITQTKCTIKILVSKGVLWSHRHGVKGNPARFYLTEYGKRSVAAYLSFLTG